MSLALKKRQNDGKITDFFWYLRGLMLVFTLLFLPHIGDYAFGAEETKTIRAQLEASKVELNQIGTALQTHVIEERRLNALRERLDPLTGGLEALIEQETPHADELKAQLERLGAAPNASKGESESDEVAEDRKKLETQFREADENIKLARAQTLRIEQFKDTITNKKRENFNRNIFTQNASPLYFALWSEMIAALPGDINALYSLMEVWFSTIVKNLNWYEAIILLTLVGGTFVFLPQIKHWITSGSFLSFKTDEKQIELSRFNKILIAIRFSLFFAIVPSVLLELLYRMFLFFGLLPGYASPVMAEATKDMSFFLAITGVSLAVFSPNKPQWRLFDMKDEVATRLSHMMSRTALALALMHIIEAFQIATVASTPFKVVTKASFVCFIALLILRQARKIFKILSQPNNQETIIESRMSLAPFNLLIWGGMLALIALVLRGYTDLAVFMLDQLNWVSLLILGATLFYVLIDEGINVNFFSQGAAGRWLQKEMNFSIGAINQLAILGSGLAHLILYTCILILILVPWGVDSSNIYGNLRAAFFGFEVGGIKISLAAIAYSIGLFIVVFLITRAVQRWLETRYLPNTGLDIGLRNSISTILGYIGIAAGIALSLGQLGLSLEKLTIVAGALSVGIGFGLQSIVSNFVSGLILLWERPIRVGDLIVVGDEQGIVKRINVRATEILTSDRVSLIIPNSEFIAGRVKNWVHADHIGRILIPLTVDYQANPQVIQDILCDVAIKNEHILSDPAPSVSFKNLNEMGMVFELSSFCDVSVMGSARSEMLFVIVQRLREANIELAYPTRRVEIATMQEPQNKIR